MIAVSMGALADDEPFTWDAQVKISGLDSGDKVNLYQVITRNTTTGAWEIAEAFAALTTEGNANFSQNVADLVASKQDVELDEADIAKIVAVAKTISSPTASQTLGEDVTEYTYNTTTAPGMYLALVEPKNPDTVYNPILVSADYTEGNNEINASSDQLLQAMAKKDTVKLTKESEDITLDAGEPVKFTVETIIPVFADSFINPRFDLTDTMQPGLALVVDDTHAFTVEAGEVTYPAADTPADGATTFTLHFDSAKIAALKSPQTVKVTYYAKITDTSALTNITEKYNDVEVEFSNNPKDDTGHGHKYDEIREYTFSIDASIFGDTSKKTGEIVKVGVDGEGNPILDSVTLDNGTEHSALAGAKFKLYKSQNGAQNETESDEYHNPALDEAMTDGYIVSDASGLMYIPGLDEGTYWIKEIQAPTGWIRDTTPHSITITATHEKQSFTKTMDDGCVAPYDVDIVTGYTVTFDGGNASTYEWTNDGPVISEMTPYDSSSEIRNTKGIELPSTGGIGTTIFYIGGSILVLAAVILLVTKRRMNAGE